MLRPLALLLLWMGLSLPEVGAADGSPLLATEPVSRVYVQYPAAVCAGAGFEVEIWSRRSHRWQAHPEHARVAADRCVLEEEARLWDELRWRCQVSSGNTEAWVVGVDMFDGGSHERCGLPGDAHLLGDMRIELRSPSPGVKVRNAEPAATIEGDVLVGGRRGVRHDVVIGIDRSRGTGTASLQVQLDAARRFVDHVAHRLGEVRVGLFVFPHPHRDALPGARKLALSESRGALMRALDRVEGATEARAAERDSSGAPTSREFARALAFGMAETQQLQLHGELGARLYARRLLLMPASFRKPEDPATGRILDQARSARERGIALHFFALEDAGRELPVWAERVLALTRGSFTRVDLGEEDAASYLRRFGLPYLADVQIRNTTTGQASREVRIREDGRFRARVPAAFGTNEILVLAMNSRGDRARARYAFEFDGTLVRERLIEAERQRIERVRRDREVIVGPADEGSDR